MKLTTRCPDNVDAVKDSVRRSPKKFHRRHSQELSRALSDKVNQFLLLSFGLTFLKWSDYFLRLRWKMTRCNMNYNINGLHLFWDTLYLELARELKNLWNMKVTIGVLLRSTRRVLDTWRDLLTFKIQWKTSNQKWCEKLTRSKIIIVIWIRWNSWYHVTVYKQIIYTKQK